jgi:hypothetical protein
MNREVHVRFWERLEVKLLRATRHERLCRFMSGTSEVPQLPDPLCAPRKSAEVSQKRSSRLSPTCAAKDDEKIKCS